ncbi:dTDP-4-amino-4,6-dideoxygalactose transaminase [Stenotrophomonas rhizophila]|jgi:dTDP-4-amino-4,6-dideoxygalactose transaminase|uniref:dTDP-4-amino-4,6-dideoxygalactose transaminase n=1 Tax=Stenotrophomonas rhizophila TaxID=216778 RepID=A0AAP5EB30_9GAMM|nr:DegT/DnrJ/EryC1/StrS family aminotransferase [Stenotrophomonas rhizophila]MDQ1109922.1 dTDP-4-amino-4,6-dideoxygalactose transaminase [Stenotrophomonas rhizophila]
MEKIPLLVPLMPTTDQALPYFRQIDGNRHYTNFGPLSRELEQRIANDLSIPQAGVTTVSNCTVGLELALQARGLRAGANVLLPSLTFVATATAVSRVGLQPVIADIDEAGWSLTPAIARRAAELHRIDAVMPVATFGRPQDMAAWDDFERETGIPVIVDAAGAYGNQTAGSVADVVFSFHATKSFGAAEGGAVISPDAERIQHIRMLSNFGLDTRNGALTDLGTNGKMSEYHCALGLASFDMWERVKTDRRALYAGYMARLRSACPSLIFQEKPEDGVYPLMAVLLPQGRDATAVGSAVAANGVETRRWYTPALHQQPALRDCVVAGALDIATTLAGRIIGLPFFLGITDAQIDTVCSALARELDS